MTILLISGSPSETSRSAALLRNVDEQLRKSGIRTDWIAVRDLPAEDLVRGRYDSEAIKKAAAQIERADAVVIATPIYKAASSGVLKAFLDLLPQNALVGKPVLPIGVGGSPAHLLAIDYSLKPVLTALGAQQQLNTLYATDKQIARNEDGGVRLDDDIAARLQDQVRRLAHAYLDAQASSFKNRRQTGERLSAVA